MEMLNIIHFSHEDITRHSKHVFEMLLHIWCLTTMRWCPSDGLHNKIRIVMIKGQTSSQYQWYFGNIHCCVVWHRLWCWWLWCWWWCWWSCWWWCLFVYEKPNYCVCRSSGRTNDTAPAPAASPTREWRSFKSLVRQGSCTCYVTTFGGNERPPTPPTTPPPPTPL